MLLEGFDPGASAEEFGVFLDPFLDAVPLTKEDLVGDRGVGVTGVFFLIKGEKAGLFTAEDFNETLGSRDFISCGFMGEIVEAGVFAEGETFSLVSVVQVDQATENPGEGLLFMELKLIIENGFSMGGEGSFDAPESVVVIPAQESVTSRTAFCLLLVEEVEEVGEQGQGLSVTLSLVAEFFIESFSAAIFLVSESSGCGGLADDLSDLILVRWEEINTSMSSREGEEFG